MTLRNGFVCLSIAPLFFLLLFFTASESATRVVPAPRLLPHVTSRMEQADFWIKKVKQPDRLLLSPSEIQRMNDENLGKPDLWLCRIEDLKEEWSREEIQAFLKEDWDVFGSEGEVRYGKDGSPLKEVFWTGLKKVLNQEGLNDRNRLLFGLVVNRTNIRVFPTDEPGLKSPSDQEFDRFQHSSLSPGSLVGIYYFSKDDAWAYIRSAFIRGWVHSETLGIAHEKKEAVSYNDKKDRLIVAGNSIPVHGDPAFQKIIFTAQMGSSFPLVSLPGSSGTSNRCYVVSVPFRDKDGHLSFQNGYIPLNEDVHYGFLPYTQENVCRQAFKMLHHPYSWGDKSGGRDCSRFIMDLFAPFGILMPRNTKLQAMVGMDPGQADGKDLREKQKLLDRATPFATTLRLPGHIMLYLGKEEGRYYAMHSLWGVEGRSPSGPVLQKIARTAVTDLSLGQSGASGSLLQRITDIRVIVRDSP